MRSAARWTYEQVQAVLDGKDVPSLRHLKDNLLTLNRLALALMRMRMERGAIDFDLPETKVILDSEGKPVRFERRERKPQQPPHQERMLPARGGDARPMPPERV